MKWRLYKKKIQKIIGKDNCKFKRKDGRYYQAIRISKALTFATNRWMALEFGRNNKQN